MLGAVVGFIIGILIDIPYSALITALLALIQDNTIAYLLGYVIYVIGLLSIPLGLAILFSTKSGI